MDQLEAILVGSEDFGAGANICDFYWFGNEVPELVASSANVYDLGIWIVMVDVGRHGLLLSLLMRHVDGESSTAVLSVDTSSFSPSRGCQPVAGRRYKYSS